ncbi:Golgin subfamily A member 7/ERF4 family-domain-containing protein [Lactarius quietus]|nr:Golgin subfamily A member 7/ERF4 family-domain-containing protein [Lactarius quietus]
MSPHRLPLHPTPWESVALPSTDGNTVAKHPSFPPTPYVVFACLQNYLLDSCAKYRRVKRSVPVSSYYFGPPPPNSAYFTPPVGQIGVHHPREIVRVERDYSGGEIVQFSSTYPLEFEGRITPTQFLESINAINEILITAHSLWHSVFDNCIEIFSLQLSRLFLSTHYEREMNRLRRHMDDLNHQLFNPVGLNILWPRKVGFLFVS